MSQFIKVGRTVINLDQIIYVEFDVASDGEPVAIFCLRGMEPQWGSEGDETPVLIPNFKSFAGPTARQLEDYFSGRVEATFEESE